MTFLSVFRFLGMDLLIPVSISCKQFKNRLHTLICKFTYLSCARATVTYWIICVLTMKSSRPCCKDLPGSCERSNYSCQTINSMLVTVREAVIRVDCEALPTETESKNSYLCWIYLHSVAQLLLWRDFITMSSSFKSSVSSRFDKFPLPTMEVTYNRQLVEGIDRRIRAWEIFSTKKSGMQSSQVSMHLRARHGKARKGFTNYSEWISIHCPNLW